MQPSPPPPLPSLHSNFFSSLRQVEKRLKLEHPPPPPSTQTPPPLPPLPAESQTQESESSSKVSLSSPLFLHLDQPVASSSAGLDSSEPPRAFLSISQDFPLTHQDPPRASPWDRHRCVNEEPEDGEIDEIKQLMELLGLPEEEEEEDSVNDCNSCHCEGGFYSKIVGVKGPKCGKEVTRLDGWIKHFREEKKEPLRLAHLLLGKTAFVSESADAAFGGLEFPSTIQEFLHNDPPSPL